MEWELVYNKDYMGNDYVDSIRVKEYDNDYMGDYRGCIIADFTASHGERKHAYKAVENNAKLLVKAPELMDKLIELTKEWEQELEEIGGCDHSVGFCVCGLKNMVEESIELIESIYSDEWENIKEL